MIEIATNEILLFRSIRRSAVLLLLLNCLGAAAKEALIAQFLDLNEKTVRQYLRSLVALGLVEDLGYQKGYCITEAGMEFLSRVADGKNYRPVVDVVNSFKDIKLINLTTTTERKIYRAAGDVPEPNPGIVDALAKAGIHGQVASELANLKHLTPAHVSGWAMKLKKNPWVKSLPGLLVHTLRQVMPGDPPPRCTCGTCSTCRQRYLEGIESGD